MAGLSDLCRHDVDIDRKETSLLDCAHDGVHHRVTVPIGHRQHGVLHEISPLLVGLLELEGVERRLVVIAAPDVVHAALAAQ